MTHRARTSWLVALAMICLGCSGDDGAAESDAGGATPSGSVSVAPSSASTSAPTTVGPHDGESAIVELSVGRETVTFVDPDRSTPASRGWPEIDDRTLETVISYPTVGDAPAVDAAPFPLILFAHGLGGTPEFSEDLIDRWVQAGFVVAAPRFPLSRPDAPGGADGGDVQNQPGDIGFLIDQLAELKTDPDSPLFELLDDERIGVAGHSNGAITTLGLTAHECCADPRIDAAIVMAGTASPLADGEYDWSLAPPMLLVHGTDDALVSYGGAISVFNSLVGPKGLLTITGGGHGEWFMDSHDAFDGLATATTDFFLGFVADDPTASDRLEDVDLAPPLTLDLAREIGSSMTIPTTTIVLDRRAYADRLDDLVDGQIIVVTWSGFTPGGTINIVQCSGGGASGAGYCDLTAGRILYPNPDGEGSLEIPIIVGPVGAGVCEPGVDDCVIIVNDSGLTEPQATVTLPLTFAD